MNMPIQFMVKHTLFKWPLTYFWYCVGGISVNRDAASNVVGQMVQSFQERDDMILVLAPEGTRKNVAHWRLGFYWIALQADVPVLIGTIDYKNRLVHVGPDVRLTGDLDADFQMLREHYLPRVDVDPQYPPKKETAPAESATEPAEAVNS